MSRRTSCLVSESSLSIVAPRLGRLARVPPRLGRLARVPPRPGRLARVVVLTAAVISPTTPVLAQHVFTAPHGGTLVMIGSEFAQLELVHDPKTGSLTAYVLDGAAGLGVRLAQETIEVGVPGGTQPAFVLLRAATNPLTGERPGDSSEFRGQSDLLRGRASFDGVIRHLVVKGAAIENLSFNVPLGATQHRDLLIAALGDGEPRLALLQGADLDADASLSSSFGGVDLFSATEPGFNALVRADLPAAMRPLERGAEVEIEIVALDPGVSVVVVGRRLGAPGDRARIGAAPDLHVHPSWQLVVPPGASGDGSVTFRLVSSSPRYAASSPVRLEIAARR